MTMIYRMNRQFKCQLISVTQLNNTTAINNYNYKSQSINPYIENIYKQK